MIMSGWSGFTEEELQKLKTSVNKEKKISPVQVKKKITRKVDTNLNNKTVDEKTLVVPITTNTKQEIPSWNPPETKSENIAPCSNESDCKQEIDETKNNNPAIKDLAKRESSTVSNEIEPDVKALQNNQDPEAIEVKTVDQKSPTIEKSNLEDFHIQQKIMEEQNKKKQQLIKQTLEQRFKETQNEAMKLKEVQVQLKKLDKLLQKDVDILREKIETANFSFAQAENRFKIAEKEYVEAKIDYYKKRECKEQLTEHLCAIIQENELRKSKKLEELLLKLHENKSTLSN